MNLEQLLKDNYSSTVDRGLITPSTTIHDFIDKIYEEVYELKCARDNANFREELADIILVGFNLATHLDIDIFKELENKVEINKNRIQ